jgi:hypothetical protein
MDHSLVIALFFLGKGIEMKIRTRFVVLLMIVMTLTVMLPSWERHRVWRATAQVATIQTIALNNLVSPGCTQLLAGVAGQSIRILNGMLNPVITGSVTGDLVDIIALSASTADANGAHNVACSATNAVPVENGSATANGLGSSGIVTAIYFTTSTTAAFPGAGTIVFPTGNQEMILPVGSALGIIHTSAQRLGGHFTVLQQ